MLAETGTDTQGPRVRRKLGSLGIVRFKNPTRPIYDDPNLIESTQNTEVKRSLAARLAQIPEKTLAKISETLPISLQHQARISKLFTNQAFRMLFFNLIDVAQRFIAHR